MKKLAWLLLIFLLMGHGVAANDATEALMAGYDYNTAAEGDRFADNTRRIAAGEQVISFQSVFSDLMALVRGEGEGALSLLLKIVAVSILFAVLTNMQQELGAKSIRDTVFFVCYGVVCSLALEAFSAVVVTFEAAVGSAVVFMNGSVPILAGLLLSGGKPLVAAGIHPVILSGCVLLSNAVRFCIVPLLYCVVALETVSAVSTVVSVRALAALLKKLMRWGLCLMLTIFTGILVVQGFGAGALDALSAKTSRYLVANAVPVVGGILTDTLDTVVTSARVILQATGLSGMLVLFAICLAPVVKIGVYSLMFHLASAVIEPVADKRIFSVTHAIAEAFSMMLGVLCAVFVMLVICIAMLMRV